MTCWGFLFQGWMMNDETERDFKHMIKSHGVVEQFRSPNLPTCRLCSIISCCLRSKKV